MVRKIIPFFAFFIALLVLNNCVSTNAPTDGIATPYDSNMKSDTVKSGKYYIKVHGKKRDFILTLPDNYDSSKSYPLVLAWHGMGGNIHSVAAGGDVFIKKPYYGLLEASDNRAIFIAGQGLLLPARGEKPNTGWGNKNGNDIAFAEALISWAESSLSIDSSRIFSIGFSMGGMFSNMIACKLGSKIRAIASISGHMGFPGMYNPDKQCKGEKVAAWFAHGQADRFVKYKGGEKGRDFFKEINECGDSSTREAEYGCTRINGCSDGYPVVWCSHPGGHVVPPYTGKEVWKFFSQF